MKRLVSMAGVIGVMACVGTAGATAHTARSAASNLPTLTLALNGKSVTVGGQTVSGAVNVVTTVTGEREGDAGLFRLNPGVTPAAFAQAVQAVNKHHGDINYVDPYGSLIFDLPVPKGTESAQTMLTPGTYIAIDTGSSTGTPPHAVFTVTQSATPAALPRPGATISSIEFGFKGPATLHDGELVRFENDGFLVHMNVVNRVKNLADANKEIADLRAGNDRAASKLAVPGPDNLFVGPVSTGAVQQQVISAKPGIYVEACFMDTQDGREHTAIGMERVLRIVK